MKRLFVALGCLAVFGAGWCFGNQRTAGPMPGGNAWKGSLQSERKMYVVGFIRGYVLGGRDRSAVLVSMFEKGLSPLELRPKTPEQKKDMDEGVAEFIKSGRTIEHTSALILEAAVSTFYHNEQNSTVCWEKAVTLSAASLAGNAPTEEELASARKEGAGERCW